MMQIYEDRNRDDSCKTYIFFFLLSGQLLAELTKPATNIT